MPIYQNFRYTEKENHIIIRAYCGDEVDVIVPETIKGKPVTEITHNAFVPTMDEVHIANNDYKERCKNRVRSIQLPDSVELLEGTFNYCIELEEITIPKNVKYLDTYTFRLCEKLRAIHVVADNPTYQSRNGILYSKDGEKLILCPINHPSVDNSCLDGVKEIGKGAFAFNKSLTSINIPETVTVINGGAFYSCKKLVSIVLHSNVHMVDGSHFANCDQLDNVLYHNVGEIIPGNEFYNCHKLKKIEFGNKIRIIGESAFSSSGLIEFVVPKGTTAINKFAFLNCGLLKRIEIPRSVSRIHKDAFSSCGRMYYTDEQLKNITTRFEMKPSTVFAVISGSKAEQFCQAQEYAILHL